MSHACNTLEGRHIVAHVLTDSSGRRRSAVLPRDRAQALIVAAQHPTLELRGVHVDGTLSRPIVHGDSSRELLLSMGAL